MKFWPPRPFLWAYVTISFAVHTMKAQDTLVAQRSARIGSFQGVAIFDYIIKDNDTIREGDFSFSNALLNTDESEQTPINIKGRFKEGLPHGNWTMEFNTLVPNEGKSLVQYQYVTTVNGLKRSFNFNLNQGRPQGQWQTQVDSVVNSTITETLFKSVIEYDKGVPIKSFSIESDRDIMVGRLLRDGLAQDLWSLYSKQEIGLEEDWKYDQGLLTQIMLQSDSQNRTLDLRYPNARAFVSVNLDQHYLDIMQLRLQQQDPKFVFNQRMSRLLQLDSQYYEMILDFFEGLGTPLKVQGFLVKVPVFPLLPVEEDQLEQIGARVKESDFLVDSILADAQLNLLKINDPETALLYQMALHLHTDYLPPLKNLITFKEKNLLQHIDREEAIGGLWPLGLEEQQIRLNDSLNNAGVNNFRFQSVLDPNLAGVFQHSTTILELSRLLNAKLRKKLTLNKREKAFLRQEQLLIAEVKALEEYVDTLNTGVPAAVGSALESLKSFAQRELKNYVSMKEDEEKLQYSSKLATCFKITRDLADTLKKLPEQEAQILELYQDQVWNPFTATVMDEEVKRRITRAYKTIIVPYYLNLVERQLTCDNINQRINNFNRLHQRMIDLRKEETKKLERKLKRTKEPEEVLSRLGLTDLNE